MENPENIIKTNIALWGITGSGKSWLVHAFAKELMWYTENDPDFIYSLKDTDNAPIRSLKAPSRQDIEATQSTEDHIWVFERRGRKNSRSHQISSHAHQIVIHDNPGKGLVDAAESSLSDGNLISSAIHASQNLILMLDPTSVKSSPVVGKDIGAHTKSDYERWVGSLIDGLLSKSPNKNLRVAVCVSKSDLVQIQLPTEEIVKVIFGEGIFRALNFPHVEKRFFKLSSVGYFKKAGGSKRLPNITPDDLADAKLLDEDNWNPINVVTPFFWLFEAIERERIRQGDIFGDRERHYIQYPPPRSV